MSWGRAIVGTLLILLGAGYLLGQLGVWDFGAILAVWWPLILIVIGVIQLATRSAPLIGAAIVIVVGLVFQGLTLRLFPENAWALIWSALLVIVGLWLLIGRGFRPAAGTSSAEVINVFALFGASNAGEHRHHLPRRQRHHAVWWSRCGPEGVETGARGRPASKSRLSSEAPRSWCRRSGQSRRPGCPSWAAGATKPIRPIPAPASHTPGVMLCHVRRDRRRQLSMAKV